MRWRRQHMAGARIIYRRRLDEKASIGHWNGVLRLAGFVRTGRGSRSGCAATPIPTVTAY
jgi:hypothetical protein